MIIVGILVHVFVRMVKYSKSAFDDSMITCDEIINVIVYQQLSLVLYQQIFITKKQDI